MTKPTSLYEVASMIAVFSFITILMVLLRSASKLIYRDVTRLRKRKLVIAGLGVFPDEVVVSAFRSHYRSVAGIAISLIPPCVYVSGIAACSFIRDLGYDIFWMPMMVVCAISGLAGWCSIVIHDQMVLKKLISRSLLK